MAAKAKVPAKTPAKAPAKKAAPKAPAVKAVVLTPVDDGVSITVGDAHADVKIVGCFDLDGLLSVSKRVARAASELS